VDQQDKKRDGGPITRHNEITTVIKIKVKERKKDKKITTITTKVHSSQTTNRQTNNDNNSHLYKYMGFGGFIVIFSCQVAQARKEEIKELLPVILPRNQKKTATLAEIP
jgi:hypothetical protein